MTDDFDYSDPIGFWRDQGKSFVGFAVSQSPEHLEQERVLTELLVGCDWETVLDVGCGWGRLARLLGRIRPLASYTGLDVGESQINLTRSVRPDAELIHTPLQEFEPGDRRWDLVLTSEVVMHVPPEQVSAFISRLAGMAARYLVLVEWTPAPGELEAIPTASWNWPHDYAGLLAELGYTNISTIAVPLARQSIFIVQKKT